MEAYSETVPLLRTKSNLVASMPVKLGEAPLACFDELRFLATAKSEEWKERLSSAVFLCLAPFKEDEAKLSVDSDLLRIGLSPKNLTLDASSLEIPEASLPLDPASSEGLPGGLVCGLTVGLLSALIIKISDASKADNVLVAPPFVRIREPIKDYCWSAVP